MTHRSFGTVRLTAERDPITFDFGIYGEETFTVIPEPMLGDTLDLLDAPEPTPTDELEAVRAITRFIRRLLAPEDRPRFSAALGRIPAAEAHIILELGTWITEQVTGFPTTPPAPSSRGRQHPGQRSKRTSAGTTRSRR